MPLHITQRGVDRCPTFLGDEDFAFYRWALGEAVREAKCDVHAYALMSNHIHLLVTPADVHGLPRLMRSVGSRYVRYFNDRYRRSGTLWEGRYRSTVVDSSAYFFLCSRYIELNPVRAQLVTDAGSYPWSSFRCNALGVDDPLVTPHREYEALGDARDARCAGYRALFKSDMTVEMIGAIRAPVRAQPRLTASLYQETVAALLEPDRPFAIRQNAAARDGTRAMH